MDYYSKYQKYKLKFLNLRKQIGGAVIWQCEIYENTWVDYSHEDSQTIEHGSGTFRLPSGHEIHKAQGAHVGTQYGLNKRTGVKSERPIRRIQIEDEADKLIIMIASFPEVLQLDSSNQHTLQGQLFDIFVDSGRQARFIQLNPGEFPDAYASRNVGLYQGIIQLKKPLEQITVEDIRTIISQYEAHQLRVSKETEEFIAKNKAQ